MRARRHRLPVLMALVAATLASTQVRASRLPLRHLSAAPPPADVPPPADASPPADAPAKDPPPDDDDDWGLDDEPAGDLIFVDETDKGEQVEKVEQVEVKGEKGTVTGRIKDLRTGDPVAGVLITAQGTPYQVSTDGEGQYALALPPGTYRLQFYSDEYKIKILTNVEVKDGKSRTENVNLEPAEGFSSETVIKAEAPKDNEAAGTRSRTESMETKDVMTAAEAEKGGGGNVANVSRRIVGSTVIGGRFLYVRGLGNRYSSTLLDGARLPSPEPEERTIPLDIFPAGSLSSIEVVKTFEPGTPADFAGASTQLVSHDIPDRFTWGVGIGMGYNSVTTGKFFRPDVNTGAADFFGFGNITRGLPSGIPTDAIIGPGVTNAEGFPVYRPEQTEAFGEAVFMRTPFRASEALPNMSLSANVGSGHDLGDGKRPMRLGWYIGSGFKNAYEFRAGEFERQYACGSACPTPTNPDPDPSARLVRQIDLDTSRSTRKVAWQTLATTKLDIAKHSTLGLTLFYSRDADNEVRIQRGRSLGVTQTEILSSRHRYIMRSILFARLGGTHRIHQTEDQAVEIDESSLASGSGGATAAKEKRKVSGPTIDWFGAYAQARRDDPAIREMLWSLDQGISEPTLDLTNGGGKLTYLKLVDHTGSGQVQVTQPFKIRTLPGSIRLGLWMEGKDRGFDVRRFRFSATSGLFGQIPRQFGDIINPSTIGGDVAPSQGGTEPLFIQEATAPLDSYGATHRVIAPHLTLDLPITRWLKAVGGVRYENSVIRVNPFPNPLNLPDPMIISRPKLINNDPFPSAAVIFSWRSHKKAAKQDMFLRLVGTQTTSRPEFRELVQFQFTDFVGGAALSGNPFLRPTYIWNADLRLEWFPSANEVVAASLFYKYFDSPIERVMATAATSAPLASYKNANAGELIGGELELRKNLGFLARRPGSRGPKRAAVIGDARLAQLQPAGDGVGSEGGAAETTAVADSTANAPVSERDRYRRGYRILSNFSIGANAALVKSAVDISRPRNSAGTVIMSPADCDVDADGQAGAQCSYESRFSAITNERRPMQGQSPYVVNAYFGYDDDAFGLGARLLFNVYGSRIDRVGANGLPDIYELAFPTLDLVVSQVVLRTLSHRDAFEATVRNELTVRMGVFNLLDSKRKFVIREPQAGTDSTVQEWYPGVSIDFGLDYKF